MGRRGKFIRDVRRGREKPRDKKLHFYPESDYYWWGRTYGPLYRKLKNEAGVAHGD